MRGHCPLISFAVLEIPKDPNTKRSISMCIYSNSKEEPKESQFIYYVYAYLREDGSPYYIGKGKGKRRFNKKHNVKIPKDKSLIIFLETNLSEIGALALERRYIEWYGRKDIGTGILRNLTDGGEGSSGYIPTLETRKKLSISGKNKKRSKETCEKISKFRKQFKYSTASKLKISNSAKNNKKALENLKLGSKANIGKKRSLETKNKIRNAQSAIWKITTPENEILIITNLNQFCIDMNLPNGSSNFSSTGKYKGYEAEKIFDRLNR